MVFLLSLLHSSPSPLGRNHLHVGLVFRVLLLDIQDIYIFFKVSPYCKYGWCYKWWWCDKILQYRRYFWIMPSRKEGLSFVDFWVCSTELFIWNFANFKLFANFILCKCSLMLRDIFLAYLSERTHLSSCVEWEFAKLQPTLAGNKTEMCFVYFI